MSDGADGAVGLERASLPELDGAGRAALFEGEPRTVATHSRPAVERR